MDKKTLLGAVSAAAVIAATVGPAAARLEPALNTRAETPAAGNPQIYEASDPLVRFALQARGDFSPESVERVLLGMFQEMDEAAARSAPAFLSRLSTVGLGKGGLKAAEDTMVLLLANARISDELFWAVAGALVSPDRIRDGSFQVATIGSLLPDLDSVGDQMRRMQEELARRQEEERQRYIEQHRPPPYVIPPVCRGPRHVNMLRKAAAGCYRDRRNGLGPLPPAFCDPHLYTLRQRTQFGCRVSVREQGRNGFRSLSQQPQGYQP